MKQSSYLSQEESYNLVDTSKMRKNVLSAFRLAQQKQYRYRSVERNNELITGDYVYFGDVDLKYGGVYIKVDDKHAPFIRVNDLESATGANGLILIEIGAIPFYRKQFHNALSSSDGMYYIKQANKPSDRLALVYETLLTYGYYDLIGDYYTHSGSIVVCHAPSYNGWKDTWDGWKPDRDFTVSLAKDYDHDLRAFVESFQ